MERWRTRTFAELHTPLAAVVGDKTAKAFEPLRIATVGDLLRHVPRRYVSGTESSDLSALTPGDEVAVVARVERMVVHPGKESFTRGRGGVRERLEVTLTDGTGRITATFFGAAHLVKYWSLELSKSERGIFVGKVSSFRGQPQLAHPDFVMLDRQGRIVARADNALMAKQVSRSGMIGLYRQASKLPTWIISATVQLVLDRLAGLEDPLPDWVRQRLQLPGLVDALNEVHLPSDPGRLDPAMRRLRFDEALAMQVTMAYRRHDQSLQPAPQLFPRGDGVLHALDERLPFSLTAGQREVSEEIFADLARAHPMQRLLQGEVGSGKTVVALRAMLAAVDAGHQAVLLAPTDVLVGQHLATIRSLMGDLAAGRVLGAPDLAIDVVAVSASMSSPAKRDALAKAASGEAGIVIGTHALLQDKVVLERLGLIVIDEQHRFGVEQRAALAAKAVLRPHVLVMTATPIPRSVAMTVYGDLTVSTLREIPSGRHDVQTTVVDAVASPAWVERMWQRVREEVGHGRQAFVVCPRIERQDADESDLPNPSATVADTAQALSEGPLQGLRVATLHGRLAPDLKDAAMGAFARGEIDVLVATTVIEVGVDVPNASVMVILDADRFGISQLHQLRGRVGRGRHPGLCLLVSSCEAGSPARQRLDAVASTRDGFALAELDLEQRREGNVMGSSQSGGRSQVRLLSVLEHADVIIAAREIAEEIVARDPDRTDPFALDMITQTDQLDAGEWLEMS